MNGQTLKVSERIKGGPGGMSQVSLRVPPAGASGDGPRWLKMEFSFDRIPPLMVNVDGGHRVVRVAPREDTGPVSCAAWLARIDDVIDTELKVCWIEPGSPASLVAAELKVAKESDDDPARPSDESEYSCVADYEKVVKSLASDDPDGVLAARMLFLRMDLATSLGDATEVSAVAHAFNVDESVIPCDPVQREQLAVFLEQRWKCRAAIEASGTSRALLPEPSNAQRSLATRVTTLFVQLMRQAFGSVAGGGEALLMFANGSLRLDVADDQLNCEPNSLAISSFAEVVDVAMDRHTGLSGDLLADARRLRRLFVSMIKPYSEIYEADRSYPRRAAYYARHAKFVRDRAWTRARLRDHGQSLRALDHASFLETWGRTLEHALSDEWAVQEAFEWKAVGGGRPYIGPERRRPKGGRSDDENSAESDGSAE